LSNGDIGVQKIVFCNTARSVTISYRRLTKTITSFAAEFNGARMNLQLLGRFMSIAGLAALSAACTPLPQYSNAPIFAHREPPVGRPTYSEVIKYIDDGVRYVNPTAAFFISPDGRMCFLGVLDFRQPPLEALISNHNWCLPPTAVGRVDSFVSSTHEQISLVCKHSDPQCVRDIGYWNPGLNAVNVDIVAANQEKSAVENLIYLMGGNIDSQSFK
jgi:hypothetical protein